MKKNDDFVLSEKIGKNFKEVIWTKNDGYWLSVDEVAMLEENIKKDVKEFIRCLKEEIKFVGQMNRTFLNPYFLNGFNILERIDKLAGEELSK